MLGLGSRRIRGWELKTLLFLVWSLDTWYFVGCNGRFMYQGMPVPRQFWSDCGEDRRLYMA